MKKIWWLIKCLLRHGSINDGSICWFSKKFYNVHDYFHDQGGDGTPSHFHEYTCPKCKKVFGI